MKRNWRVVQHLVILASLAALSGCVPKDDSLAKVDPYEADPVQAETWSNSFYTGEGSSHGIEAPRSFFGLGPRKTQMNYSFAKNIPEHLRGLNWQAVDSRVSNFGTNSNGLCARGTKNTLSTLLGQSPVAADSVDACEVTDRYLNQKFSKQGQLKWNSVPLTTIAQSGLQPGDVIVCNRDIPGESWDDSIPCRSGDWGKRSGHIEFVDASQRISSDFKQRGSGCLSSARYQNARVYRSQSASALAQIWYYRHLLKSTWLINEAQAQTTPAAKAPGKAETGTPATRKLLVKNENFGIFEDDQEGSSEQDSSVFIYEVYQKQNNRWVRVNSTDVSAYHAVETIASSQDRRDLAKALTKKFSDEYGRDRYQQKILERVMFTASEKDSYLDAGFKIPQFYKITN